MYLQGASGRLPCQSRGGAWTRAPYEVDQLVLESERYLLGLAARIFDFFANQRERERGVERGRTREAVGI